MKLINGGIYKSHYLEFALIFVGIDGKNNALWSMLYIHRHSIKGMSNPSFQTKAMDNIGFTEKELKEKFDSDNWILLDGRLRIEKIDDMSFVDYPNGKLEKYDLKEDN